MAKKAKKVEIILKNTITLEKGSTLKIVVYTDDFMIGKVTKPDGTRINWLGGQMHES